MLPLALLWPLSVLALGAAPEPWQPLSGLGFVNPPQPASPDPLVSYAFPASVNGSQLQLYEVPAVSLRGTPPASFANLSSAVGRLSPTSISVLGPGSLVIDFGVEGPCWLEFDSPDLQPADLATLVLGSSEFSAIDFVAGYKAATPAAYDSTYRLETNKELYEGLRYGFFLVAAPLSRPFTITRLASVCQAKPVNYEASFSSPGDPLLASIWYTGAYTVRATLQSAYMGSILEDRGDRQSWTGDAHPTQLTSMTVFGNYPFVLQNLLRTQSDCQGIATYCLYFVLSTLDYWRETGDSATLALLTPNIIAKLEAAHALYAQPRGLRFVGHDDRLGSGFANSTTPETQALFRFLALRCWREFAAAAAAVGNGTLAAHFSAYFDAAVDALRGSGSAWWAPLGLHAAGDAVNAGFANATEQAALAETAFSSLVVLPSQSNFNQYFLLQAMGALGLLDRAVDSARLIWGAQIELGATTFWEQSHPDWARFLPPGPSPLPNHEGWVSLCHPWSSGITPWLTRWVLGIRPLSPSYATVLLAPHLTGSSGTGLAGAASTPHGPVRLELRRAAAAKDAPTELAAGTAVVLITLPQGCNAVLQLSEVLLERLGVCAAAAQEEGSLSAPPLLVTDASLSLPLAARWVAQPTDTPLRDERTAARGGAAAGVPRPRSPAWHVTLPAGRSYELHLRMQPRASSAASASATAAAAAAALFPLYATPFPPLAWPSRLLAADTATQGNWRGVYGDAGYTLFGLHNATPAGTLQSLPPWVASVTVQGPSTSGFGGHVFSWTPGNGSSGLRGDARALQDPSPGAVPGARGLGAAAPQGTGSFPTDIVLTAPRRFRLAAYFCDFGGTPWGDGQQGSERWQSVYLLEAYPSLNPAAPRMGLQHFQGGTWLVWEVQGSVRLRVSTVRGDYAVLSALAFDELTERD